MKTYCRRCGKPSDAPLCIACEGDDWLPLIVVVVLGVIMIAAALFGLFS